MMYVNTLAIDPSNPNTIYAGTIQGGVCKSTNGGDTWIQTGSGLTDLHVRSLAIDPSNPTTIYAGTDAGGVFKSTNGGDSWNPINSGLTAASV